ncbi:hypothetical protein B2J88_47020 [Rhodococcus sp. SRB_17]|nr:hypothetical protein [Rhodococcus sp. SRB_17]
MSPTPPAATATTQLSSAVTAVSGPILAELRELAQHAPGRARVEGWRYLRELSAADRRDQIGALFAAGTRPEQLDGAYEGLIVGKLFNVPEAALANPLLAINPTWRGKTFNAESGTGFNRLIPLARYAMRVIAPLYRGLRRVGPEIVGFDFRYSADVGLVTPNIPVIALDYGVEEYSNPSVRTFPIKRTRDEIVELLPGLYLGRALLRMHSGEIRTIAHFALRHFENEEVRS